MSVLDNVPDSTDWLATPLSGFAAVEAALRCEVCKDFYTTPMITSCSHTFCSLCIRRALSNDGKCPLCRATEQELKLRSNWSMEETVEAFSKVRAEALRIARSSNKPNRSPKRRKDDSRAGTDDVAPQPKRLRTSARLSKNKAEDIIPVFHEVEDDDGGEGGKEEEDVIQDSDDGYTPDIPGGLVPCPLCQKKMKEWQVFNHLESCPGPGATPSSRESTASTTNNASPLGQLKRKPQRTLERLPPLNYSMLKEQALRKKMAELGISNQGPRLLLERRHKEWLTLWNANCDAALPKKRSELQYDLEVWERTQGGRAPISGKAVQNATVIKDKDFDGAAWASKHDVSFKDLIANARKSRLETKGKVEEGGGKTSNGEAAAATDEDKKCPSSLLIPSELGARTTESGTIADNASCGEANYEISMTTGDS